MVSGDKFVCKCGYQWKTRKDFGEPFICPKCKKETILNISKETRDLKKQFAEIDKERQKEKWKTFVEEENRKIKELQLAKNK